ncbi:hypothetical protein ACHAXN_008653 [Cyclotella atomus]
MAPIIIARSISQDSTESSIHSKARDDTIVSADTLCPPPEIEDYDNLQEDTNNKSNDDSVSDSKLTHQSSNLFIDEDKLHDNESFITTGLLSTHTDHSDNTTMQLSSSRKQRFGIFSPSGSGELQEVSLTTSPSVSNNPSTHLSALGNSLIVSGFDQRQIDADEELAHSLQAEEDKRLQMQQRRRKPKPRGSTLECWFEDSISQLGKQINESAIEFFGGKK